MDRKPTDVVLSLKKFLTKDIWTVDHRKISPRQALFLKHLRIGLLVFRRFIRHRVRVRASALVYVTLMSLIPLLAVVFSLLRGFGYHNELEPLLTRVLYPLGEQAIQVIVPTVMDFVKNARVAALGGIGFLVFLVASISIIKNMERAFNDIWEVEKKRRLRAHLSGIILIPVLTFIVFAVTATLRDYSLIESVSSTPIIRLLAGKAAPLIFSWLGFLFFLNFIPNTKVRFLSSLYGAVIAGSLWQLLNYFFSSFYVAFYNRGTMAAVYASFVAVPLFLIWLYFSWMLVLLGATITYVHQNFNKLTWEVQAPHVSWRMKESIAIKTILLICQRFRQGQTAPSQTELAEYLNVPEYAVTRLISVLSAQDLVRAIDGREERYVPAKSLEAFSMLDTIEKLRNYGALFRGKTQEDAIGQFVGDLQKRHEVLLQEIFPDPNIRVTLDKIDEGQKKT